MTGYTLRLGCSIVLSLIWLWFAAPLFHIERSYLIKLVWVLSILALVCGRLGYVLMHITYFSQNPLQLFQLHRTGGIHGESSLLGGLIGLGIWAAHRNRRLLAGEKVPTTHDAQSFSQSFEYLLALFTPAILCVAGGAWWACMQTGCAWGRAINLYDARFHWLLISGPDLYHTIRPRYPVQLLGIMWALVTATLSAIRSHHVYHGTLTLMLYCVGATVLTLLRGDSVPTVGQLRVDTIQNIGIAFTLGGIRLWHRYRLTL